MGWVLLFWLRPWFSGSWNEFWHDVNSLDLFFIALYLVLIICLIILRCIIKDAEEDLTAIMKLKDGSETHLGNRDVK